MIKEKQTLSNPAPIALSFFSTNRGIADAAAALVTMRAPVAHKWGGWWEIKNASCSGVDDLLFGGFGGFGGCYIVPVFVFHGPIVVEL